MSTHQIEYRSSGKILSDFIADDSEAVGIMGPWGSGKSVGCAMKLLRYATEQDVCVAGPYAGMATTRWMVCRQTSVELRTTTLKTWLQWFPENVFGRLRQTAPITHHLKFGNVDAEFVFLAMDDEDDVKKLDSMEYTGAWLNEVRQMPFAIPEAASGRAGRYPPKEWLGGADPRWYGIIADTNAPALEHWFTIMSGLAEPPETMDEDDRLSLIENSGWSFHVQPPAMFEVRDGSQLVGYEVNPEAENLQHLPDDYYQRLVRGKRRSWIRVFVQNIPGGITAGKPVHDGEFNRRTHVRKTDERPDETLPLSVGVDFGHTPAIVIAQQLPDDRIRFLYERAWARCNSYRLAEHIVNVMKLPMWGKRPTWQFWGDPSGDGNDETAPFKILRAKGIPIQPAPGHNALDIRISAFSDRLDTMIGGLPAIEINPRCRILANGLENEYQYPKERPDGVELGASLVPIKNRASHVVEAGQYVLLGLGEGARVQIHAGAELKSATKPQVIPRPVSRLRRRTRERTLHGG